MNERGLLFFTCCLLLRKMVLTRDDHSCFASTKLSQRWRAPSFVKGSALLPLLCPHPAVSSFGVATRIVVMAGPTFFKLKKNQKFSFFHYFFLEQHKEGKRNQKIPSWFVAIERGKKNKKNLKGLQQYRKQRKNQKN